MSADWAVGDLALYLGAGNFCGGHTAESENDATKLSKGTIYLVVGIRPGPFRPIPGNACRASCGLHLAGIIHPPGYCADCFRKIRPDEHEGNADDWNLLTEQFGTKVSA